MKDVEATQTRDFVRGRFTLLDAQRAHTEQELEKLSTLESVTDQAEHEKKIKMLTTRLGLLTQKLDQIAEEDEKKYRFDDRKAPIYICNICNMELIGEKYTSMETENFHLCSECYKTHGTSDFLLQTWELEPEIKRVRAESANLQQLIKNVFNLCFNRPAFGYRVRNRLTGHLDNFFTWFTFGEVWERIEAVCVGLKEKYQVKRGDRIGICGYNRLEWFVADFACILLGATVVPLHYAFDHNSAADIIENSNLIGIFCFRERVLELESFVGTTTVKFLVHFGFQGSRVDEEHIDETEGQYPSFAFGELELLGRNIKRDNPVAFQNIFESVHPEGDDLLTIIYTSGSTGKPKGVPFTNLLWQTMLHEEYPDEINVSLSMDSLAHISDREDVHSTLLAGGRVGFKSGASGNVQEDCKILRPTAMSSTPRFWNILFNQYQSEFSIALTKFEQDKQRPPTLVEREDVRQKIIASMKTVFGDRIKNISTGGAATAPNVKSFLHEVFDSVATVGEGYACSEAGQITRDDGSLYPKVEYKLIDCPQLNYFSTDLPHPRGEFCVKTPFSITSYFNNPTATESAFDSEGYFHTGDIVEVIGQNKIRIIDRIKNIFKLSQGEFVAPEKLENVYVESNYVSQIFISCADLALYEQNAVLGVIVVDVPVLQHLLLAQFNYSPEDITNQEKIKSDPQVLAYILSDLNRIGLEENLRPWELVRGIILEFTRWTVESQLMTPSFKLARPVLERKYKDQLNQLAKELDGVQTSETLDRTVTDLIVILSHVFNIPKSHINSTDTFSKLGGDSLSAIQLITTIKQLHNVSFPLELLFQTLNIAQLQEKLDELIHRSTSEAPVVDLSETLLADTVLEPAVYGQIPISECQGNDILLTGATGFLGIHILYKLLTSSEIDHNRIIWCLIRCESEDDGMKRLQKQLDYFKLAPDHHWEKRVKCIPGCLSKPLLGLTEEVFNNLVRAVDQVYHNGAYVNHVLPYSLLKPVNVDGTKEILRFVFRRSAVIQLIYISTLSVINDNSISQLSKTYDITQELNTHATSNDGYGQSKWVAEMLVKQAAETANNTVDRSIRVMIIRPGMLGWNSETGVGNLSDWIYRLLLGSIALGIHCSMKNIHWRILPVDIAANNIVSLAHLSITNEDFYRCGNVFNFANSVLLYVAFLMSASAQAAQNLLHEEKFANEGEKRALEAISRVDQGIPHKLWWGYVKKEINSPSIVEYNRKRASAITALSLFEERIPDESATSFNCDAFQIAYSMFTSQLQAHSKSFAQFVDIPIFVAGLAHMLAEHVEHEESEDL